MEKNLQYSRVLIVGLLLLGLPIGAIAQTQTADVATTLTLTPPTTVNPGNPVSYTVSVVNNGPNPAQNVVPQVQLPAGLASSVFTLPGGASYTNATGIVTLPTSASLAAGTTLSYSISFTAPYYSATLLAVASSTASNTDPVPTNNDGSSAAARATVTDVVLGTNCTGPGYGPASPVSGGLYAEYYAGYFNDNLSFFNTSTSSLSRYDATVNFPANNSWGDLRPAGSGTVDNPQTYSARYRGSISIATTGTYTFSLRSDDASYLWLDGAALATTPTVASATVNNGGAHGATTVSATVTLTAGPHNVLIFYGQNAGGNNFIFSYAVGTNTLQPVPNSVLCATQVPPPLPVQLTAFVAKAAGSAAQLTWTTASEQNSAYFAVERSSNGHTFTELGQVLAQGNKTSVTDYTYRDAAFGAQPVGQLVYYRLRQVDQNSTVAFSPVRSLVPGKVAPSVSCYPVPATEDVTVDLQMLPAQNFELILVDLVGRVTRRWNLAGGQLQHLSLSGLPVGLYQLLVTGTLTEGTTFHQNLRLPKE